VYADVSWGNKRQKSNAKTQRHQDAERSLQKGEQAFFCGKSLAGDGSNCPPKLGEATVTQVSSFRRRRESCPCVRYRLADFEPVSRSQSLSIMKLLGAVVGIIGGFARKRAPTSAQRA